MELYLPRSKRDLKDLSKALESARFAAKLTGKTVLYHWADAIYCFLDTDAVHSNIMKEASSNFARLIEMKHIQGSVFKRLERDIMTGSMIIFLAANQNSTNFLLTLSNATG